jgi:hypothetical protein
MPQQMTTEQFAEKVKAKYPQYKSIPDADLTRMVLKKYPQYQSQVKTGPEAKIPYKEAVAARPVGIRDYARTLGEELGEFASAFNPLNMVQAARMLTPAGAVDASTALSQAAKEAKADPYAYMLSKAPRAIGQAAGAAVLGRLAPEIPGYVNRLRSVAPATAAARLTERLAPMIEGEPVSDLTNRLIPRLGIKGSEKLSDIAKTVAEKSRDITSQENGLLNSRLGSTTVGDTPVGANSVAQSLRSQITDNMQRFDPKLVKAILERANQYESGNPMTIRQLQGQLRTLNEKTAAFYAKPDIEAALAVHDPHVQYIEAETRAVRDAYYDALSRATGQDLRSLKKFQSDLISMQKALGRPLAREAKTAAQSEAHPILGPKGSLRRKALKAAAIGAAGATGGGAVLRELYPSH